MHFFTFLLMVISLGTLSRAEHWNYKNHRWGGVCDAGKWQSPINLDVDESTFRIADRLKFKNYDRELKNFKVVNTGHSFMVTDFEYELTIRGGLLAGEFVLVQFHMHWDSEHTVNGIRYDLEVHFVHRNIKYPDFGTAVKHKDGVVVLGALYDVTHSEDNRLESYIRSVDAVKNYDMINKHVSVGETLVVNELLPSSRSYYTYFGSLTTPTCAEVVTWIVLTDRNPVNSRLIHKLKEIEYEEGVQLRSNYRKLQRKRNREVILVSNAAGLARLSLPVFLILAFVFVN